MSEEIFQIGAKGLIRNPNGQVFMLHLRDWGDIPAHWDLPGGRVDEGEDFEQALAREMLEEVGLENIGKPKQLLAMKTNIKIPYQGKLFPYVYVIYEIDLRDVTKLKLAEAIQEDELGWFDPKEAAKLMEFKFTPEFCEMVRNLC